MYLNVFKHKWIYIACTIHINDSLINKFFHSLNLRTFPRDPILDYIDIYALVHNRLSPISLDTCVYDCTHV